MTGIAVKFIFLYLTPRTPPQINIDSILFCIYLTTVVRTANPANLGKSSNEWTVNGVGRKVSHSFGYGLMDAAAMVRLARVWEIVPEQQRCEIHSPHLDK